MKLGIRVKFAGILVLATVLPIAIAIIAVNILGYKSYRDAEGKRFQGQAEKLGDYLTLSVEHSVQRLHDWLVMSEFPERLEEISANRVDPENSAFGEEILDLEERWPELSPGSDEIAPLLTNELAQKLRRFQALNPRFAEIFVTDRHGRLVASTNKTSDYWQANELWWQKGREIEFRSGHVEGIHFDESAGVYSFDLAIPIRDPENPQGSPVGVAKGVVSVLDTYTLFFEMAERVSDDEVRWKCILSDGTIVFGLDRKPLEDRLDEGSLENVVLWRNGWMVSNLLGDERDLVGYASLPWTSISLGEGFVPPTREELERQLEAFAESTLVVDEPDYEFAPLLILVHAPANEVFAPVRAQLRNLTIAGIALVLLASATGFFLAQHEMIRPIRLVQAAARHIAGSNGPKQLQSEVEERAATPLRPATARILERVRSISSTDELGELARDFESMAQRVLRYREHLEVELAAKSREVHRDLEMAREFQEALMPQTYPRIPPVGQSSPLKLDFSHLYLPASTVGGDFFNVVRLSDRKAGIFIADVMGHGACSALVTAIVGTLLHDLVEQVEEPGDLLTMMNRHFYLIMQQCSQLVFASAFYMTIDLEKSEIAYASAGHPAPLRGDRDSGKVERLIGPSEGGPALGLVKEVIYSGFRGSLGQGALYFLFTDGVLEALNSQGEEFGVERLQKSIEEHLGDKIQTINNSVLDSLIRFCGSSSFADDICFLTVEVAENTQEEESVVQAREIAHQHGS